MPKIKSQDEVAKFVTGSKQTKSPTPKSLTPKIKAKDNKKRLGKYGKVGPYP